MTPKIAGVASTDYGKHPERSSRELFEAAAGEALADAGVRADHVESVYLGNFAGELTEDQGHMGPMVADVVGARTAASLRVDSACASGGVAARLAAEAVAGGRYDVALVGGVEMMHNVGIETITDALANAGDNEFENEAGLTFPGIYAMMARAYLYRHGVDKEALAAVAVKNRANAAENPIAQFDDPISVGDVLEARPIATPLTLLDSCPLTDGASAAVVVSEEYARRENLDASVSVLGVGQSGDTLALQARPDVTWVSAADRAATEAYERAGIEPTDLDLCEVHDCFTIAEVLALEALGLYDRGAGATAAADGDTWVDGEVPVNPSGGLLSKGHPVGATGVGQIVEAVKQLEGRHPNQVDGADLALTHNVGGSGASAVVHVLGGDR